MTKQRYYVATLLLFAFIFGWAGLDGSQAPIGNDQQHYVNRGRNMAKILVEHEDVGAWDLINSTFLTTRWYERQGPDGPMSLECRPTGTEFVVDTAPTFAENDDRQRGILFQLGTFREDVSAEVHEVESTCSTGCCHKGSHTEFMSIEFLSADPDKSFIVMRGEYNWINVLDEKLAGFPMNAFHALYFWPGTDYLRGEPYRQWRKAPPNDKVEVQSAFRDKRLNPRLELEEKVRPDGTTRPQGALLTYWNGGGPYTIRIEHHEKAGWGGPTYLKSEFDVPWPLEVRLYNIPGKFLADRGPLSEGEARELIELEPEKVIPAVMAIHIRAVPRADGEPWTHGGIHDDPWTKP
ncbi:MAG: hypothetical protein ACREAA_02410 [Candidatus Polarisedimenticolia bacterium]